MITLTHWIIEDLTKSFFQTKIALSCCANLNVVSAFQFQVFFKHSYK